MKEGRRPLVETAHPGPESTAPKNTTEATMDQMASLVNGVHSFLATFRKQWRHAARGAPDGRDPKGRRWSQVSLLGNGVLGKMTGMRSLRGLEQLTEVSHGGTVGMFGDRRMPDNTLEGTLTVTGEATGNWLLTRLCYAWHRAKMLAPCREGMIGKERPHVVVYDGKTFMQTSEEQPAPYHRKSTSSATVVAGKKVKKKVDYWAVDIVRAVLVSSVASVCVGLKVVDQGDEVGAVRDLDEELIGQYRWFAKNPVLILADAKHGNKEFLKQQGDPYGELPKRSGDETSAESRGLAKKPFSSASEAKAGETPDAEKGHKHYYLLKVKGNAGHIYKEGMRAARLKASASAPEAWTDFEEAGHGRKIKRELWRVDTNIGRGIAPDQECRLDDETVAILKHEDWPTVRQVVLVKQTTCHKKPRKNGKSREAVEWRLAVTNIKKKDVTAMSLLRFLRMEWGIEVYHNLLDQVMREDDKDWARKGLAPVAMAALDSIAANAIGMLKSRHLRSSGNRECLSYPQLVTVVLMVMTGGRIAQILAADKRGERDQLVPVETGDAELDPAFTKQWSDAELAQLLTAIRLLFGFALRHLAHHHRITLTLSVDVAGGGVSMALKTE